MKYQDQKELFSLLHKAVKDAGPKNIADYLDKSYPTLMGELNPIDDRHKLGLMTFFEILEKVDNQLVLEWITTYFNYILVRKPEVNATHENAARLMIRAGKEFGDISRAFLEVTDELSEGGETITSNEWKKLDRELNEAIQVFYQLRELYEDN
ncbi:MAG: hypothetical protein HQM11_06135 [SAR324 cluster bacterium]|nr:hypothetical protein [SAR324 cluster bacterium]